MSELEALRAENERLQEMILRLEEGRIIDAMAWVRGLFECSVCYEAATGVVIEEAAVDNGRGSLDARPYCAGHGNSLYRSFEAQAI